jgi:formiminotetrahydrofolate cyclodeaminase
MTQEGGLPEPVQRGMEALWKVLDPSENSTGGGTASALAGAMAASLVAMVARLSRGKRAMEPQSFYAPLVEEAQGLSLELMEGAHTDAQAFYEVMEAYHLPKDHPQEREARHNSIQRALEKAAQVPLHNARLCARVLHLRGLLEKRSLPSARSDLQCAGHLALAGLRGCLDNVWVNLPHLESRDLAEDIRKQAQELAQGVQSLIPE